MNDDRLSPERFEARQIIEDLRAEVARLKRDIEQHRMIDGIMARTLDGMDVRFGDSDSRDAHDAIKRSLTDMSNGLVPLDTLAASALVSSVVGTTRRRDPLMRDAPRSKRLRRVK